MPHSARKMGESGFYHVVPKGIADQLIFMDDGDRRLYTELLREAKEETGVRLHAYCLMSNHVHLIVEDRDGNKLSAAMKYLHERYAMHFAEKVNRTGGIFRRPFWSEPIESESYLLCAVRYVHANPAVAGICPASAYVWSSAKDYLGRADGITDTETVLSILGGRKGFIAFSNMANATATAFPGSKLREHVSDEEAVRLARYILDTDDLNLASRDFEERREASKLLVERGLTAKQVARICGISLSTIRRAK